MQTVEDVEKACAFIREAGTSSRVPVPITTLLKLCADARAWQSAPPLMKDAIKAARAE